MNHVPYHLRLLFVLLWAVCFVPASASHLVGGELSYRYLGPAPSGNGASLYEVTLNLHINCNSQSEVPYVQSLLNESPDHMLSVGVYHEDPSNPNANKLLFTELRLALIDSMTVEPIVPPGCTLGDDICVKQGVFRTTAVLPASPGGYHLFSQLCCRILGLINLSNSVFDGIGYYAFIPPTSVPNSSPEFFSIPTPFPCIGDTTTYLNTASDADGDQLVFSFSVPYLSTSSTTLAGEPVPAVLEWPLAQASYTANFGPQVPFGPSGGAAIDPATGISLYAPANIGRYIVVVEVREFRNGQLIGISRRDVQVQAVACGSGAANTPPTLADGSPMAFHVEAGSNLCADLVFVDAEGQVLTLVDYGPILDPTITFPTASLTPPVVSPGQLSTTFCWAPDCDQGREQPYLFAASVTDNGCPSKTLHVTFQVYVHAGPSGIVGPADVCANTDGYTYHMIGSGSGAPVWTVTGGTLVSGQGTGTIVVDWDGPGGGLIAVVANNSNGCTGNATKVINIGTTLPVELGPAIQLCAGDSIQLGSSSTGTWSWSPAAGLSYPTIPGPMASPTTTTVYTATVTENGCSGTGSVEVIVVAPPVLDLGNDVSVCSGQGIQLGSGGAGSWSWSPATGLDDATIATPTAAPTATTTYIGTVTENGCSVSDTIVVTVTGLPSVNAGTDRWICIGSSSPLQGTGGGTASWTPTVGLDDPTSLTPVATPGITTTYMLTITDGLGCSNSDSVTLTVGEDPPVDAGTGFSLCQGQNGTLQGTAVAGASLTWWPIEGLDDPFIGTPVASPASTTIYTLTATVDTCTASDTVHVTVRTLGADAFTFRIEPGCDSIRAFIRAETSSSDLLWDLGDGTHRTEASFQHYFAYGAPILVSLTATDEHGCSATSTQLFPADTLPELTEARPMNVFTPNGDGKNDHFSPMEDHVGACATLVVLNRWGQKVFESLGNNVRWDGRDAAGQVCTAGTYFYTFTLRDLQWQGTVELIR